MVVKFTTEPVIAKALALGVDVVTGVGVGLTGGNIAKLLVVKLGLAPDVTSVGRGDIGTTVSFVPVPAVVIYGALNKL
jgi:hypothetical protein